MSVELPQLTLHDVAMLLHRLADAVEAGVDHLVYTTTGGEEVTIPVNGGIRLAADTITWTAGLPTESRWRLPSGGAGAAQPQ